MTRDSVGREHAAGVASSPDAAQALSPADFPIERCARIAASIDDSPDDAAKILGASEISESDWRALEDHWQSFIDAEIAVGTTLLLSRYDHAYVEQLASGHTRLDNHAYARLVVAAERGTLDPTLRSLGLPRAALTRVERVWIARLADAQEAKAIRSAIGAARQSAG